MFAAQTSKQILIVDRDVACVEPLRHRLSELAFVVSVVTDASAAAAAMAERPPHLVIIDWSMPGFAPLEVIERARATRRPHAVGLIILSALCEEQHVIGGLNTGADDYIAKPFSLPEAVARVCAVLRTRARGDRAPWAVHAAAPATNGPALLGSVETRLLDFFKAHPGRVFTRAQLLGQVWGATDEINERTVDVNIQRLRKFLNTPGHKAHIETIRGFGYRFVSGNEGDTARF
jgi:two-component system phosphate regulon response regulator PhoB